MITHKFLNECQATPNRNIYKNEKNTKPKVNTCRYYDNMK